MSPILLSAHIQPMLWGGRKLADYGFTLPAHEPIGEAWTLSVHPQGRSKIADPRFAEMDLYTLWQQHPEWFGVAADAEFPILVKWIDAQDDLSVQVHPDDQAAQRLAGLPNGKTECWYIVAAEEEASIIFGHHCRSAAEFATAIQENTLLDKLQRVPVKAGDFFFVPAGTVHALTKGCLVLEVQQNSNTTYRLYDYDRRDKVTGLPRELHVEQGVAATHYPHRQWSEFASEQTSGQRRLLTHNGYFFVEELKLQQAETITTSDTFQLLSVIAGEVTIEEKSYGIGATLLLPAQGRYQLTGEATLIVAGLPTIQKESVRLGIDLGGTQLRVAAIDAKGQLKKQIKSATATEQGVDYVINNMIAFCQELQKEFHVTGVGVASPGPLDARTGVIQSPPNLPGWDNIPLKTRLETALHCPIAVENDANAAALGEAIFGAGRDMESSFYITVSTGIGGGFVFRDQLVSGAQSCAGEIGNMIISSEQGFENPALNRGALETLASGTALNHRAQLLGLSGAAELLQNPAERARFVNHLAVGIANVIHTLNPHLIILGGGVTASVDLYWDELLQAIDAHLYPQLRGKTPIQLAKLGGNAGVIGAAALITA